MRRRLGSADRRWSSGDEGGDRAERYTGLLRTPRGSGPIASNLVLRFTGPGELVASGHPQGRSALPENLGLIRFTDGGRNWSAVSELGRLDFHSLDARGANIVGLPAESTTVLSSDDGGRTFEQGTAPAPAVDLDVDPRRPERVVLATRERIFVSVDSGRSWRPRDVPTSETHLAWSPTGPLYRVEAGGAVKVSSDTGDSWRPAGNAGGSPSTASADRRGRLHVALRGAVVKRSDDGGRSFRTLVQLR